MTAKKPTSTDALSVPFGIFDCLLKYLTLNNPTNIYRQKFCYVFN